MGPQSGSELPVATMKSRLWDIADRTAGPQRRRRRRRRRRQVLCKNKKGMKSRSRLFHHRSLVLRRPLSEEGGRPCRQPIAPAAEPPLYIALTNPREHRWRISGQRRGGGGRGHGIEVVMTQAGN